MQKINLVIPDNMDYRTSEAYRTLRTNVLFCGEEINAIAVTSCTPGEGKSEVSFRLAESLAETDRKILYIDADLRRSDKSDDAVFLDGCRIFIICNRCFFNL